jgi:hypothetical protein
MFNGMFRLAVLAAIAAIVSACTPSHDADQYVEFVAEWGGKGVGDGQFLYIEDIAQDNDGMLLVTDALRADVQKFDPGGRFLGKFGGRGTAAGERRQVISKNRKVLPSTRRAIFMLAITCQDTYKSSTVISGTC